MPPSRKSSPKETKPSPEPDFEQSFQRLEELVDSMEHGDLPLEKLLAQHDEGMALIKRCESLLGAAEERIQRVQLAQHDSPEEPAPPSRAEASPNPPQGSDSDDISLF